MVLLVGETKQVDFEERLKYGKEWENRFAKYLISIGWFVTPKYLFTEEGAPILIGKNNKYAIPDIDAAKDGNRIWFECKRKARMKKYPATGYSFFTHTCYKKVQEITGDKVFVIFEDNTDTENVIHYGNYLDELEKNIFSKTFIIENEPHILFKYPEAFIFLKINGGRALEYN